VSDILYIVTCLVYAITFPLGLFGVVWVFALERSIDYRLELWQHKTYYSVAFFYFLRRIVWLSVALNVVSFLYIVWHGRL
jgi:hypothetical protein